MKLDKMGLNAYKKNANIPTKTTQQETVTEQPLKIYKKNHKPPKALNTDKAIMSKTEDKILTTLIAQKETLSPSKPKGQLYKSGSRKAAELLLSMNQIQAAKVLQHMKVEEVSAVIKELAEMKELNKKEQQEEKIEQNNQTSGVGGIDVARGLLKVAFGNEEGERILQNAAIDLMPKPFRFLEDLDNDQLVNLLKNESLEVLGVIIPRVNPSLGKKILQIVPLHSQADLIKRIALNRKIEGSVITRMEEVLHKKLRLMGDKTPTQELDGAKTLANILRYMSSNEEKKIMENLNTTLPQEVKNIEDNLFGIESLLLVQDRDLQEIFRTMTENELAVLLKGKETGIRKKILKNLSVRRRENIADEERIIGPMRLSEVDKATREFLDTLRIFEKQGKITLLREGEIYL